MILTVDTAEELRGEKAVWIFPVPAEPEKSTINLLKGFPNLHGYDVEEEAKETVSETFMVMRLTQIYTFPLFIVSKSSGMLLGASTWGNDGVTVHQRIEKMGLTTELISAADSQSFSDYLARKDLELPGEFKSILDEYIGKEYSFVITWISDTEKFRQQNPITYIQSLVEEGKISEAKSFLNSLPYEDGSETGRIYERIKELLNDTRLDGRMISADISYYIRFSRMDFVSTKGNTIGVFIRFPTEKIYYPLKPTSVYGDTKIPTVIYVMGHVTPELYPEIKTMGIRLSPKTKEKQVNYFVERHYDVPDELSLFFNHKTRIENLKYTKIKIDTPSKYLTRDLWIKDTPPLKLRIVDFVTKFPFWCGLFFFIVCSCLASLLAGIVLFRDTNISKRKFALLGLFNILTLFGFGTASYFLRTKEASKEVKDYISKNGISAFENPAKKYYFTLSVFACLSILLFFLREFELSNILVAFIILIMFPITILAMLMLFFKLSRENLKKEHESNPDTNKASYNVIDIKKLLFLIVFNLSVFLGTLFLIIFDYNRLYALAKLSGFMLYKDVWLGYIVNLPVFILCIISSGIIISVLLLTFLDKFFKNKFGTKGFYILQKDARKFWFVVMFTIFFMILTVIFQFLLITII